MGAVPRGPMFTAVAIVCCHYNIMQLYYNVDKSHSTMDTLWSTAKMISGKRNSLPLLDLFPTINSLASYLR